MVDIHLCRPVVFVPFFKDETFSAKASEVPRKWWVIDARTRCWERSQVKGGESLCDGKAENGFHATAWIRAIL